MKNSNKIILAMITAVSIVFSACTEKIDLNLQSSKPTLVIEANISNEAGPYFVRVSKSQPYYQTNNFEKINPDYIIISDDIGHADTLSKVADGLFQTNTIQGMENNTYHLKLKVEGVEYQSHCYMAAAVALDSVASVVNPFGFGPSSNPNERLIVSYFMDPASTSNFYVLKTSNNGRMSDKVRAVTDRLKNGKLFETTLRGVDAKVGDTVEVQLQSVSSQIYTYYDELEKIASNNTFAASVAPANPTTNIAPTTLGYFSAHAISRKKIVVY